MIRNKELTAKYMRALPEEPEDLAALIANADPKNNFIEKLKHQVLDSFYVTMSELPIEHFVICEVNDEGILLPDECITIEGERKSVNIKHNSQNLERVIEWLTPREKSRFITVHNHPSCRNPNIASPNFSAGDLKVYREFLESRGMIYFRRGWVIDNYVIGKARTKIRSYIQYMTELYEQALG
jgi:hypothetical protein